MTANVPKSDVGSAIDGMNVERTFLRNRKMTRTTRTTVSRSVSWTSRTLARIPCERSNMTSMRIAAGICCRKAGRSALTASTTSIVFESGWRAIASTIDRFPWNHAACLSFSTPSTTFAISPRRTGAPPRQATIRGRYAAAFRSRPFVWTASAFSGPYDDPDGLVRVPRRDRGGDLVDSDLPAREDAGIDLDPHGVLLRAVDVHLRDAADGRDPLGEDRLGPLVDLVHGKRRRGQDDEEDRRRRGIDLVQVRGRRHATAGAARASPRSRSATSCAAASMSRSRENCEHDRRRALARRRVHRVDPRDRPRTAARAASRRRTPSSPGWRPGGSRWTWIVGKSTFGRSATGSERYPIAPNRKSSRHDERRHDGSSDEEAGDVRLDRPEPADPAHVAGSGSASSGRSGSGAGVSFAWSASNAM